MNPTQVQDLLKSLEPEKGQAEEMHGRRFDDGYTTVPIETLTTYDKHNVARLLEYFRERCRRAESLRVPEGLRESIKAAILARTLQRMKILKLWLGNFAPSALPTPHRQKQTEKR